LAPASNEDEEDDDNGVGVLWNFVLQSVVPNGELHLSPAVGALFVLLERGAASPSGSFSCKKSKPEKCGVIGDEHAYGVSNVDVI
jgi:hypothetical protein